MKNFRLQILLERTPISDADKHNILVIFNALSLRRQQEILDNWDEYSLKIIEARKRLDEEQRIELIETLKQANTLLDEAIIRQQEREEYKQSKQREIRKELESTVAYEQLQKLKKIKEVSRIPA
jgi:hypothetical protein